MTGVQTCALPIFVSEAECRAARPELAGQIGAAIQARIQRHIDEQGTKDIAPDILAAMPKAG